MKGILQLAFMFAAANGVAFGADECLGPATVHETTAAMTDDAPFAVRICDADGDGDLDLVTANDASDTVSVLLNDGLGSFGELRRWPVGVAGTTFEPVDVDCCDFNGDGIPDLVTVNHTADNVSILLGTGLEGGVPQFAQAFHHAVGEAPWAVRCAPLNEDAHPDLAIANFTSSSVSVLINDGSGAIAAEQSYAIAVASSPRSLTLCDMDGDFDLDVITANLSGKSVTLLRNDGEDGLTDAGDVALAVNPFAVTCCDLDGNNGPEIITANIVDDSVTVLFNDGLGGFGGRTRTTGANGAASVACADFDLDGDADLVTANLNGGNVTVFENSGNGGLLAPVAVFSGDNPSSVAVGRFVDGAASGVAAAFADGAAVLSNGCGRSPDIDGDGAVDLRDFAWLQVCFGVAEPLGECAAADLDISGLIDLADYAGLWAAWP